MPVIVTLDNVYRAYKMGPEIIKAVDGISLKITQGECAVYRGPSGSGKSTLLHLMAGLDKPTKVQYRGKTRIDKLNENQLAVSPSM